MSDVPSSAENQTADEKKPRSSLFRRTRAGIPLTRDEVREIKRNRKALRKELKKLGITDKEDFELEAIARDWYLDKRRWGLLFFWLFRGRGLAILLALALAGMGIIYAVSRITQMRGFFTINLTDNLFDKGFTLTTKIDSKIHSSVLNLGEIDEMALPDTTINKLPKELDLGEGNHSGQNYFAYSFYLCNEGNSIASYRYELYFSNKTGGIEKAVWIMVLKSDVSYDGEISTPVMAFYAKANETTGEREVLPDESRYFKANSEFLSYYMDMAEDPEQFQAGDEERTKYRYISKSFKDDKIITEGEKHGVSPGEKQKYTIVMWVEGNDPDCTNELIGTACGVAMQFYLIDETDADIVE